MAKVKLHLKCDLQVPRQFKLMPQYCKPKNRKMIAIADPEVRASDVRYFNVSRRKKEKVRYKLPTIGDIYVLCRYGKYSQCRVVE